MLVLGIAIGLAIMIILEVIAYNVTKKKHQANIKKPESYANYLKRNGIVTKKSK